MYKKSKEVLKCAITFTEEEETNQCIIDHTMGRSIKILRNHILYWFH